MHYIYVLAVIKENMKPGETYDEWHRRSFPEQYVWENFEYPHFGMSENQSVCRIPFNILGCENCELLIDNPDISVEHKRTIEYIISNQSSFIEDSLKMTFDYYKHLWSDFLYEFEDEIKYPNPDSIDHNKMTEMITPKTIHIANKISEGYFGLTFSNTFELEHGLGIRFRNYKIEEVGGEDIGFNLMPEK
jgi:hypothetical protein